MIINFSETPPEAAVLRALVSGPEHSDSETVRSFLNGPFDWDRFVALAEENGASGLIASHISDLNSQGLIPGPVAAHFATRAIGIAAMSMRTTAVVEQIYKIAAPLGIPLIVMKGAAVSHLLYENPSTRFSGDIDLLCKEEDYTRLHDALTSAGFVAEDERQLPGKCSSLETAFEQHFRTPGDGIPIELHVDSIKLGVKPNNADSVWERAIPVNIGKTTALSLSYRDLALMLPVHLHRHGFTRLAWFKDIELLIKNHGHEIDWDLVVSDAEAEGATSSLWLTLGLLRDMLGTDLPEGLVQKLRPSPLTRLGWRLIWPRKRVLALEASTKRRVVQFSVGESWRGTIPSLVLMGRRREKLAILFHRRPWRWRRRAKASS